MQDNLYEPPHAELIAGKAAETAAGVLLLFMRKAATIAFGLYFAWGCVKLGA
jgi:hypothetical protein